MNTRCRHCASLLNQLHRQEEKCAKTSISIADASWVWRPWRWRHMSCSRPILRRHSPARRTRSRRHSAGYRVIVPYLRGYGTTRFLSNETPRNGQQSALAADTIALMDALAIKRSTVAGFDWGARTANIVAALWPERCKAMVSVSGYLIGSREANRMPLPPKAELEWWYQYYFATDRGRAGYEKYRHEFARLIWQTASPQWRFDDATFDRSAKAFDNPDHVSIVIHKLPVAPRARRRRSEV
jgi:pimeloyl-ACP methyl ester carboxylesterase